MVTEEELARRFLEAPGGGADFGKIDDEASVAIGKPAGPIRLQVGYPGSKGYGNRHIEAYPDRMKQITNLGFSTFTIFAYRVAQHYTKIGEAQKGRLSLIFRHNGYDLQLIVEYMGAFWTIVTGLPYRVARVQILHEVTRTGESEPTPSVADKRPRLATLSLPGKVSGSGS